MQARYTTEIARTDYVRWQLKKETTDQREESQSIFRSRLPTEGWYPGPIASDVHGLSDVRCLSLIHI